MGALELFDLLARELMLFAAVGLLLGGLDDVAVDLWFWGNRLLRPRRRLTLATLPPAPPTRFAVFIPAWDEAAVIGQMLAATVERIQGAEYRLFVGVYPNDPATAKAARAVEDARIEVVVGPRAGPTTKADNLNRLWAALTASAWRADAVIIHDAEDVVHPAELRVFAALVGGHPSGKVRHRDIVGSSGTWWAGKWPESLISATLHDCCSIVDRLSRPFPSSGSPLLACRP